MCELEVALSVLSRVKASYGVSTHEDNGAGIRRTAYHKVTRPCLEQTHPCKESDMSLQSGTYRNPSLFFQAWLGDAPSG